MIIYFSITDNPQRIININIITKYGRKRKKMKHLCLKCNTVFWDWGKKPGRFGGFIECCPNCGNTEIKSIKRNFGFSWTNMTKNDIKLLIIISGILVIIIGFILSLIRVNEIIGVALITIGVMISILGILFKTDK